MKEILKLSHVSFKYGAKIVLEDVNISILKGECYGILGVNGSGKTTLINCILSDLQAKGSIQYAMNGGVESYSDALKYHLGIVLDNDILVDYLTLEEYLNFVGDCYNIEKKTLRERIDQWIHYFNLQEDVHRLLKNFSHGMRKKTQLIAAILHNPSLVIVDEPTNGLDIESIYHFKQLIQILKSTGTTFLISTHDLKFIEDVCDRVGILNHAKIEREIAMHLIEVSIEKIFLDSVLEKKEV